MDATIADVNRLRSLLGERIPAGGSDEDTLFDHAEILELFTDRTFDEALLEGWRQKAAELANLVDTAEGTSKRANSDLSKNALAMVAALEEAGTGGSTRKRAVIHNISREADRP